MVIYLHNFFSRYCRRNIEGSHIDTTIYKARHGFCTFCLLFLSGYNSWSVNMYCITPPAHLVSLPQPDDWSESSYCQSTVGGILLQKYPKWEWISRVGSQAQIKAPARGRLQGWPAGTLQRGPATGILPSEEERTRCSQHRAQACLSWASLPWSSLAGGRVVTLHPGGPKCKYQINILQTWGDSIWVFLKKKNLLGYQWVPFILHSLRLRGILWHKGKRMHVKEDICK